MDKVFAVQNCGISGTLFLQSLFDGHPQILMMPALHALSLLPFWEENSYLDKNKNELLDKFLAAHPHYFTKTAAVTELYGLADMGVNKDEIAYVDKALFTQYLLENWHTTEAAVTRKQFIESIHIAYNRALGRQIDENGYLLYPIHCSAQRYAIELAEDFAEVKFLHMMRESIQNFGSLANHISKNNDLITRHYLLSCCIAQIYLDHTIHVGERAAHGLKRYLRDSHKVTTRACRLEDIHRDPRHTLKLICDWLGIAWDDCLLQSTFDGKLWHNRTESIRQTGFGTQTISQKHAHLINRFDRFRLKYLSSSYNQFYGYTKTENCPRWVQLLLPLLLMLPFKIEYAKSAKSRTIKNYLKCRLRWLLPAWRQISKPKDYIPLLD